MPARNVRFVGRDALIEDLRGRLRAPGGGVQVLRGAAGAGKTQLAAEFVHRHASDYDLVWWVPAEQESIARAGFALFAAALGRPAGADPVFTVHDLLRRRTRWLVVFDNANDPDALQPLLPPGTGHVLVTTRNIRWRAAGPTIELKGFDRAESVRFLREQWAGADDDTADRLADYVEDLPIMLAQAVGWQAENPTSVGDYLELLTRQTGQVLGWGAPVGYPRPIIAVWDLSLRDLRERAPEAVELLELCAFFAPEPIARVLLGGDDPAGTARAIAHLGRAALITATERELVMHRLLRAHVREGLGPEAADRCRAAVQGLLARHAVDDPADPHDWAAMALISPHIVASGAITSTLPEAHRLVLDQVRFLRAVGDRAGSRELARAVVTHWRVTLGAEHPSTVAMSVLR